MYHQEVISAICASHAYEYVIIDEHMHIVESSLGIEKYCEKEKLSAYPIDVYDVIPELIGQEEVLLKMLQGEDKTLFLATIYKMPEEYVNIRVQRTRNDKRVIVLFEDITEETLRQQNMQQMHHENILLLEKIEDQNRQLKRFNQEMQKLVDEEMSKNIEQRRMLDVQTRYAQMGEMMAMITHQWKQPLSAIQTTGMLLKLKYELETLTPKIFEEKMNSLLEQTTHMNKTVNDFQQFFRPSKKEILFNLYETISTVIGLVSMEYALYNIDIELSGDKTIRVYGNANEYSQAVLAIVQNAKDALVTHCETGRKIKIKIFQDNERSLVSICDNAGGIPEALIQKIFDPYVTTKTEGSGLGLYIAKRIMEENMPGELLVNNAPQGAEFRLYL